MKREQLEQNLLTRGAPGLRGPRGITFLCESNPNLRQSSWAKKDLIANVSSREEPALLSADVV